MNFLKYFLKLTEYTTPFGYESDLEYLLPNGWKKDTIGNYYYEIGNSTTLFTAHLDNACTKREKINHIIDGNIIKTDGTTILGGDNKAGCLVLFYMIKNNVPGTYYFFIGEEMSVHKNYPHGSLLAIESNEKYFTKFKRVISFDRKEKGQLITRQLGKNCCSNEFADYIISEFKDNGIIYEKDKTGYYTDSAFFSDIIPEIINLSVGVWNEHCKNEYVDIEYIKSVAISSIKVKWENSPIGRKIDKKYVTDTRKDIDNEDGLSDDQKLFSKIFEIMDELYFVCHEFRSYQNYVLNFKSGRVYHFVKWHEDDEMTISISNGVINCNGNIYKNINDFKKSLGIESLSSDDFYKLMFDKFLGNNNKLTDAVFNYLMYQKNGNIESLEEDFLKDGWILSKIGKGYEIVKKSNENKLNHILSYSLFESINFKKLSQKKGAKTDTYDVYKNDMIIGQVKWYSRMRGYSFLPTPDCSDEVKSFIKSLMDKRRMDKKKSKNI